MAADTTIKVPIKVDTSQSNKALDDTGKKFKDTGNDAKKAGGDASAFFKGIAANALAFNAAAIIGQIHETAASYIEAGAASNEMRRTIAATSLVLENTPWDQATSGARELQEELEQIGMKSGFAGSEMRAAYTAMLESTDGTAQAVAHTHDELSSVAKVADAFGMSIENAGREISFMHEGTLRTRGQMFQLLKSTGIFGQDVHKAAEAWQGMTDAQRTEALARGLEQVAAKVEKLPPSYRRLVGQVKDVFELIKKDIGEPIIDALVPEMQTIVPQLATMRTEVKHIAQAMGPEIAKWIHEGTTLVADGLQYISTHAEEIKSAISSGFEQAKRVVDFILAHKESLAAAFGANAVISRLPSGQSVAAAGTVAGQVAGGAVRMAGGIGAAAGFQGTQAVVAGFGALAAAATAAAIALSLINEANDKRKAIVETAGSVQSSVTMQAQIDPAKTKKMLDTMRATDEEMDRGAGAIGRFGQTLNGMLQAIGVEQTGLGGLLGMTRTQFDAFEAATISLAVATRSTTQALQDTAIQGLEAINEGNFSGVTQIVAAYNAAQAAHNTAAMQFAASALISSGFTAESVRLAGSTLRGGLEEFAANFAQGTDEVKAQLGVFLGKDAAKGKAPVISMSGGQSFKITQDFRDQDPDRVAIAFQEGVGRMVERRLGANTSGAFGT